MSQTEQGEGAKLMQDGKIHLSNVQSTEITALGNTLCATAEEMQTQVTCQDHSSKETASNSSQPLNPEITSASPYLQLRCYLQLTVHMGKVLILQTIRILIESQAADLCKVIKGETECCENI